MSNEFWDSVGVPKLEPVAPTPEPAAIAEAKPGFFETALRGGFQGITSEYGDEAIGKGVSMLTGVPAREISDQQRALNAQAAATNPLTYYGSNIAGSIAQTAIPVVGQLGKVGQAAKGVGLLRSIPTIAKAAGAGALSGAITSVGAADSDADLLKAAQQGAETGGILGGVFGAVAPAISSAAKAIPGLKGAAQKANDIYDAIAAKFKFAHGMDQNEITAFRKSIPIKKRFDEQAKEYFDAEGRGIAEKLAKEWGDTSERGVRSAVDRQLKEMRQSFKNDMKNLFSKMAQQNDRLPSGLRVPARELTKQAADVAADNMEQTAKNTIARAAAIEDGTVKGFIDAAKALKAYKKPPPTMIDVEIPQPPKTVTNPMTLMDEVVPQPPLIKKVPQEVPDLTAELRAKTYDLAADPLGIKPGVDRLISAAKKKNKANPLRQDDAVLTVLRGLRRDEADVQSALGMLGLLKNPETKHMLKSSFYDGTIRGVGKAKEASERMMRLAIAGGTGVNVAHQMGMLTAGAVAALIALPVAQPKKFLEIVAKLDDQYRTPLSDAMRKYGPKAAQALHKAYMSRPDYREQLNQLSQGEQ